jgi:hypothetical protein
MFWLTFLPGGGWRLISMPVSSMSLSSVSTRLGAAAAEQDAGTPPRTGRCTAVERLAEPPARGPLMRFDAVSSSPIADSEVGLLRGQEVEALLQLFRFLDAVRLISPMRSISPRSSFARRSSSAPNSARRWYS